MKTSDYIKEKDFNDLMSKYNLALEMVEAELKKILKENESNFSSNPVDHIKSRIKAKDSLINKLKRKNLDITLDNILNNIHDVIGIRIVCSFINDVYDVVNLIKNNISFNIIEAKDYITKPKYTGYLSYHIIIEVPVFINGEKIITNAEIQIRTIAMDFWASIDHKIDYKIDDFPEKLRKEMYECSLDIEKLDRKMLKIKEEAEKYYKNE